MSGRKGKILVAMSGGVDSSMSAILLRERGYDVVGVTMKIGDPVVSYGNRIESACCSLDAINDARTIALKYDFPHYTLDMQEDFKRVVIDNFVDEYLAGRTPNPCVICNKYVKWHALLRKADKLGCTHIATGHYVKLREVNGRMVVSSGKDDRKDQSYMLWAVSQESLRRTLFPLSNHTKPEVRRMIRERGFDHLADKDESVDLCFVPDDNYRNYLRKKVDPDKLKGGDFVTTSGEVVGRHEGYPFYTIGQRKGLGIALGERMYVTAIKPETNTVVIGPKTALRRQGLWAEAVNLMKYDKLKPGMEAVVRIRYNHPGASARLYPDGDRVKILFDTHVAGIAPGQSAVFYEGDDVIGGGRIVRAIQLQGEEALTHALSSRS